MTVRRWLWLSVVFAVCSTLLLTGAVAGSPSDDKKSVEPVGAITAGQTGQISVTGTSINRTTVETGNPVTVEGIIENEGEETAATEVTLTVDGESVETRTAEAVQPGFPVIARFEWTPETPGRYRVAINGVEAGNELVAERSQSPDSDDTGGQSGDDEEETTSGGDGVDESQFSVQNVSLDPAEIAPGETTTVVAAVGNNGEEVGDYEITLEVDGESVQTETVPQVDPLLEVGAQGRFDFTPEEAGSYTISVNGVEATQQLVVEESGGGGGLFGFLDILPLGLLRPVILFVGLPILLIYLALKGLALYLGY